MNITKNVIKMFKVLIVGSSLMAASALQAEDQNKCKIELKNNSKAPEKAVTCLDEYDGRMTLEEILKAIELSDKDQCLSPFCNCWLG